MLDSGFSSMSERGLNQEARVELARNDSFRWSAN
jgi:hypothetical protein